MTMMNPGLSVARAVADAVLYEGYLLYPYRASSQKNQSRWQFGILGPPGAAESGVGEEAEMFAECLVQPGGDLGVEIRVRFLQLQTRAVERAIGDEFMAVDELIVDSSRWLRWEEATEHEITFGPFTTEQLEEGQDLPVAVPADTTTEVLSDGAGTVVGRLVRHRAELRGTLMLGAMHLDDEIGTPLMRLHVSLRNVAPGSCSNAAEAIATSFIGAHLLLSATDGEFVSLVDPPETARLAAVSCRQQRFWPVLAGPEGQQDILLLSPIILYDHPTIAPESSVALYDSTEIDEILTLRILTLTDEEKAEARATDPRAAAIIDSCEAMTPEQLQQLHGVLRNPRTPMLSDGLADAIDFPSLFDDTDAAAPAWWEPEAEALVQPHADSVMIDGVPISRGSRVRVNPQRRADAQDIFFAGQTGAVASVHFDVDGSTHIAVTLDIDPAAELHNWYGRYLYFAPDEVEPLHPAPDNDERKVKP